MTGDTMRERVIAPVADNLAERARELADVLLERFRAELPELYRDAETIRAAHASTEASVRALARTLAAADQPVAAELPAETIAYARDSARQGIPVAVLLRLYRIGHAALWNLLVPELVARAADAVELADAVERCSATLFAYIDAATLLAEEVYAAERERFARSAAAVRVETIAAILDGALTDPGIAGRRLRHDLNCHHVGLWAWLERAPDAGDAYDLLERALLEFARAAGFVGVLAQPLGTYAVAGWISTADPPDMVALAATRLPAADLPGARIALGEAGHGIAGFRATHEQATSARRVAALAGRAPGTITRYDTIAVQALASEDPDHARAFVHRVLGPLAGQDDTTLRLAATLRAYLDEHASRSRAAKHLGIHENTVSYRIKQVEEILGRSVEQDTLDLRVALALTAVVRDG